LPKVNHVTDAVLWTSQFSRSQECLPRRFMYFYVFISLFFWYFHFLVGEDHAS
jgi:hypothetical protein